MGSVPSAPLLSMHRASLWLVHAVSWDATGAATVSTGWDSPASSSRECNATGQRLLTLRGDLPFSGEV